MSNKNESSSDVIVKLVIFLGAIAAIAVAVMVFLKFRKKKAVCDGDDAFCFDDEDFCDDYDCCCDCAECEEAKDSAEEK